MNQYELSDLQVFYGRLTENAASFYAQLPASGDWSDPLQLVGEVTGPHCDGTRTLPATVAMRFQGADPRPLAVANVPDPTFWSPALPALYDVAVTLMQGSEKVASRKRRLALRRFGAHHRSFVEQGRRTVIRGASDAHSMFDHAAEDWYEHRLHYLLTVSDDTDIVDLSQQLDVAQRTGFPIVTDVTTRDTESIRRQFRLLASCAAVTLTIVGLENASHDVVSELARNNPNLRLLAELEGKRLQCPDWALGLAIRVDEISPESIPWDDFDKPVVLRRSVATPPELSIKRQLCEQLQRDFATVGDFAGYLIG